MNERSKKQPDEVDQLLDDALQQWGEKHTADPTSLNAAKARTLEALLSGGDSAYIKTHASNQIGTGIWKALVSLAALVAIAVVGVWSLLPNTTDPEIAASQIDSAALEQAKSDPQNQQLMFIRFRELFGNQLNSVSEVDDEVHVSIDEFVDTDVSADQTNSVNDFVAVELVFLSRPVNSGNVNWNIEHRANVLTRSQHRVDVEDDTSPFAFSIWALPVEDRLISIDLHCRMQGELLVEVTASELQRSGAVEQVHSFTRSGVEYRLYQSVTRLNNPAADGNAFDASNLIHAIAMNNLRECL